MRLAEGKTLHAGPAWYTFDFGVEIVAVENHGPGEAHDWAAYIGAAQDRTAAVCLLAGVPAPPGLPTQDALRRKAAQWGAKLDEPLARFLFPALADVEYRQ